MKKWIYLIIPGVMLVVFLVFYFSHEKEAIAREKARAELVAKKTEEDKKQKAESESKARESAKIAQVEREASEAKKEADRRKKQLDIDREIKETTDAAVADGNKASKRANELEIELARLQREKDRIGREAFDLAKKVELTMVAKRNAELEEQRLTEMIARKAAASAMAKMPPPPPPPPPPAK
jgi:hypothetical protein